MIGHAYSCQDVETRMEAALDGELPLPDAELVAEHLRVCPHCVVRENELRSVGHAIRFALPPHRVPASLMAGLRADIAALAHDADSRGGALWPAAALLGGRGRALGYAASLVAVAALGWITGAESRSRSDEARIEALATTRTSDDVLAAHVRSMLPGHLLDVRSSDRHTVKPWFAGKVNFAPRVEDLVATGFPLLGGRLDYVDGHQVVALVYARRQHIINLFVWPSERMPAAKTTKRELAINGYTARSWQQEGMTYWAVSDVAGADLIALERLYQSSAAGVSAVTR